MIVHMNRIWSPAENFRIGMITSSLEFGTISRSDLERLHTGLIAVVSTPVSLESLGVGANFGEWHLMG